MSANRRYAVTLTVRSKASALIWARSAKEARGIARRCAQPRWEGEASEADESAFPWLDGGLNPVVTAIVDVRPDRAAP